jgi:hypothetical protein
VIVEVIVIGRAFPAPDSLEPEMSARSAAAAAVLALTMVLAPFHPAAAEPNPVTPGDFRGYGFDQCLAPTQRAMDVWLNHSPFLSVGIYISGNSRACRSQPNLTPRWIGTQLRKGWRLLPITLGPQASCSDRFPRYDDDPVIIGRPGPGDRYPAARRQGRAEAEKAVAAAKDLGIVRRSTLWYDLEAFDHTNRRCRESALAFLSAWTNKLHDLRYVSGVYSSAGSGIKVLDDVRVERPDAYTLPDMIWIARWDGKANTSTSYIRDDGWRPGARVKQYLGGHNETWGGVTINIDRNFLDVGRGRFAAPEEHCGGADISFQRYPALREPTNTYAPPADKVKALQCLLQERGLYGGRLSGNYNPATIAAVQAWQESRGFPVSSTWSRADWVGAFAQGRDYAQKFGSTGLHVRRVQRALNAADPTLQRVVDGIFKRRTAEDVSAYQRRVGLRASGIVNERTWARLRAGRG